MIAPLAAIAAGALAIGIILGAGLPGSSRGASQPVKSSGATSVQRRDLVATDTESGTLGYANPQTVFNRVSGTITWLPSVGQVVGAGETLYRVDGNPIVLFSGPVPAYRTLSEGVSDGPDVQELKENLIALGYDPSHQITVNQTYDAATTAAVERWQAGLGQTQTGTVTLGSAVFLPGTQRITSVDTVLGSTGGSAGSGSSGSGSSGSGSGSGSAGSGSGTSSSSSLAVTPARPQFVSLTSSPTNVTPDATATMPTTTTPTPKPNIGKRKPSGNSAASTLAALIALLKAETAELRAGRSTSGSASAAGKSGAGSSASRASAASAAGGRSGGSSGSSGSSGASGAGASAAGASTGSGGGTAQPILQTTSTQLVVKVQLDATKQSEAVTGEPVTVEMPDGSTVDGKITNVSPVAQTSSSSSSSSGAAGGSSSSPSATIPVTIALQTHRHLQGLDQAAVSVNFEQQKATNVFSVPVTALLATAGGGYALQEAAAPHTLIAVTPGLFAAGFVQVTGPRLYEGLQVTDSQG